MVSLISGSVSFAELEGGPNGEVTSDPGMPNRDKKKIGNRT